jgi:hypothetical protein
MIMEKDAEGREEVVIAIVAVMVSEREVCEEVVCKER